MESELERLGLVMVFSKQGISLWTEKVGIGNVLVLGLVVYWIGKGTMAVHSLIISETVNLIKAFLFAPPIALVWFVTLTVVLYLMGRFWGGTADFGKFVKSMAWAHLPLLLTPVPLVLLGWATFSLVRHRDAAGGTFALYSLAVLLLFLLAVWVAVRVAQAIVFSQRIDTFKAGLMSTVLAFPVILGIGIFGIDFYWSNYWVGFRAATGVQ